MKITTHLLLAIAASHTVYSQQVDEGCRVTGCAQQLCVSASNTTVSSSSSSEACNLPHFRCFQSSNVACTINPSTNQCQWQLSDGFRKCLVSYSSLDKVDAFEPSTGAFFGNANANGQQGNVTFPLGYSSAQGTSPFSVALSLTSLGLALSLFL